MTGLMVLMRIASCFTPRFGDREGKP
jgi:hypothetical protein